jgi:hypothetical protein
MSFPVAHTHAITSGDATSGDVTAPHRSSSNDKWMVLLYYSHIKNKMTKSKQKQKQYKNNKAYQQCVLIHFDIIIYEVYIY